MQTTSKLFLILFIGSLLGSCINPNTIINNIDENLSIEEDFTTIEINDEYSVSIPNYMKEATNLNDEASLQYQNVFKEAYVIVIDEPKADVIATFQELGEYDDSLSAVKNYRDIQLKYLKESIEITAQSDPISMKFGDLDAEGVEIDGRVEGVLQGVSYFLTFIEGEEKVYMIMAWTLEDKKVKYKSTYGQVAKSFKLLGSE